MIKDRTQGEPDEVESSKRGRPSQTEWQERARFALRHLGDPINLESSPFCQMDVLEMMAQSKYPRGIVARGRALNDLLVECLQEIETELDGHSGVSKLKQFVKFTRQGMGVTEASRQIGVTPEYTCRTFKRDVVKLLTEKLLMKLR